jgi:hypothetical protein
MAERVCRFVTNRGIADSPPSSALGEVVYETFILPVMGHFPEFTTHLFEYENEPGSLSDDFLEDILAADIVIADITELSPSGYFHLGRRHSAGRPIVFIGAQEYVTAIDPVDFRLVRYPMEAPGPSGDDKLATSQLIEAVRAAIADGDGPAAAPPIKLPPKQARAQLSARIREAAEAISLLRINSAADTVAELEDIAGTLQSASDENLPQALNETAEKFLKVLARFADQLATVRGARMLIAGIIAVVLGGTGVSAITAYGMSLAFWEGRDAFVKAIELLAKRKK